MKPLNLIYALLVCFLMSSCEKSFELKMGDTTNPGNGSGNGGNAPAGALYKIEQTKKDGVSTEEYEYDANGRLIKLSIKTPAVTGITFFRRFERDNIGRVVKMVSIGNASGSGVPSIPTSTDSIVTNVHYPSASSTDFDYSTSIMKTQGITGTDSVVYVYTGNKITKTDSYNTIAGVLTSLTSRIEYTYDANGNIIVQKTYMPDSSGTSFDLLMTYTMEYDNKEAPLLLGNEWLLGGGEAMGGGKNNPTKAKIDINSLLSSIPNITMTVSYQYNNANKPSTATTNNSVDGTYTSKFYYK